MEYPSTTKTMKKYTIKGILDGFRGSVTQPTKSEADIEENLRHEHFQVAKLDSNVLGSRSNRSPYYPGKSNPKGITLAETVRHGFPHQPTALAFDPVQRILAVGTKSGSLRLFGRPGVDCHVRHEGENPILQILFLINEGALVTVCADDTLHLWNLRQKKPDIVHTLKFQRERITYCQLPFQSKWLYIGTERGNVHIVNIESFTLSGYVINWNKAIELARKTHPGSVIHLSENTVDPNKLLIGYETSAVVLWDLRTKTADARFQYTEPLKSISWHFEGKQFMCSHSDGSLTTWNIRSPAKPQSILFPHAKTSKDGKPEPCKPINKVEWKTQRSGESFILFSGGLTYDRAGRTPSITVIHGKATTVLEMEHNVVDFITLCESPWQSDLQEPYAVVVLLHNDLVVVDLTAPGYLCFENPYPMDLHESPVTSCSYLADCPSDLIPAFYSVGSKAQKRTGFSDKEWPINGGAWGTATCSYAEVIITGHADGSMKFWDASAVSLQILYKLKTAKIFERPKAKSLDGQDDDPFAIHQISICPESRYLCVAGSSSHIILFRFSKQESVAEIPVLEIPIVYEGDDDLDCSPEYDYPPRPALNAASQQGSYASSSEEGKKQSSIEYHTSLRVKAGPQKRAPGFQADLVCLTPWVDGEPPGQITTVSLNSSYGLLAYGNETGLVVVDFIQKTCLLNMGTPDLYGSADPYQRIPRSPKKNQTDNNVSDPGDRCRSPTSSDQTQIDAGPPRPAATCTSSSSSAATALFEFMPRVELTKSLSAEAGLSANESVDDFGNNSLKIATHPQKALSTCNITADSLKDEHMSHVGDSNKLLGLPDEAANNHSESSDFVEDELLHCPDTDELSQLTACRRPRSYSWKGFTFKKKAAEMVARQSFSGASTTCSRRKSSVAMSEDSDGQITANKGDAPSRPPRKLSKKRGGQKASGKGMIVDLRNESDGGESPVSPVATVKKLLTAAPKDKIDSSFSRSRSSSMSSIENITSEAIQCLVFSDSFTRKNDAATCPTLWVGTSLGSVLVIILNLPPAGELRQTQPVIVSPSGTIFRLKGAVQCLGFLDCNGALIPYSFESWKDANKLDAKDKERERIRTPTKPSPNNRVSPSASTELGDRQFVVITSEKQARVVALPSQTCAFKSQLTEHSFVVKTDIIAMKDDICLACYIANGHIAIFSLPSLRILMDVDFVPLIDLSCQTSEQGTVDPMISIWGKQLYHSCESDQTARTFCFGHHGHGMYLCSPCEIQKFTVSARFCDNLQEMLGELFLPCETPEAPKESFFKGLFGGGVRSLDREELFGEASGKASRSIATKHTPGMNLEHLNTKATGVAGEVGRAHQGLVERGEKLGTLEDRTERLMTDAEVYHQHSQQLLNKYKDKKWYQF